MFYHVFDGGVLICQCWGIGHIVTIEELEILTGMVWYVVFHAFKAHVL